MTDDETYGVFDPNEDFTAVGDLANRGATARGEEAAKWLLHHVQERSVTADPDEYDNINSLLNNFAALATNAPDGTFIQALAELGMLLTEAASRPLSQQVLAVVIDHDGIPRIYDTTSGHAAVWEEEEGLDGP